MSVRNAKPMDLFDFFKEKKDAPPPQTQSFRERRLLPRWQINCAAQIRWEGLPNYLNCEIRNLNLKGFAVSLSQKLPESCANISLQFGSEFIFNVEIAVLWRKEAQGKNAYGVRFTKIRDADKEKIFHLNAERILKLRIL